MNIFKGRNVWLYFGIPIVFFFHFADGYFAPNHLVQIRQQDSLLIFTGSDWCLPCMRLERDILSDSLFIQYTHHNIKFIQVDFPQKKKLDSIEIARNEKLAELYNPNGIFPYIVVVENGLPTQIPFRNQPTKELISSIQHILQGHE